MVGNLDKHESITNIKTLYIYSTMLNLKNALKIQQGNCTKNALVSAFYWSNFKRIILIFCAYKSLYKQNKQVVQHPFAGFNIQLEC